MNFLNINGFQKYMKSSVHILFWSDEIILPAQIFSGSQGVFLMNTSEPAKRTLRNPVKKDMDSYFTYSL